MIVLGEKASDLQEHVLLGTYKGYALRHKVNDINNALERETITVRLSCPSALDQWPRQGIREGTVQVDTSMGGLLPVPSPLPTLWTMGELLFFLDFDLQHEWIEPFLSLGCFHF